MGGQRHAVAALPREKIRCPMYGRLGWAQGRVWTAAETSRSHRGFESRISQSVANRYTDNTNSVPILILVKNYTKLRDV